jgi:zinc protease
MLRRIETLYGNIPAGELPRTFARPEPDQQGERRITVERPGRTPFIDINYRVPAVTHDEWFALEMLNSILCGADGLGGGSVDNKTSRLYKALVTTELAASVSGSMTPTIDPFLYSISITVRDGCTLEEVEAACHAQIQRVLDSDITEAELNRAKKQARALFAYSTERVTMQAFWLAVAENFGDYQWPDQYVSRLEAVTLEQIHAAAQKYLRPQNRIVGWLVPTGEADDIEEGDEDDE